MNPTSEFFSKLRKLAVTLETETERLERVFASRSEEDSDAETTARAMRAYHELNCEVCSLKEHIRDQLTEQKEQEANVNDFIKACGVMEQKVSKDVQAVRTHLEKYGYRAPTDLQRLDMVKNQDGGAEKVAEEDEPSSAAGEAGGQDKNEETHCSSPPKREHVFNDVMLTPQLSDFGLSEIQLRRALAGAEWCSETPSMPEINLPQPSLNTPALPPMPVTPKCALRMDDKELQTPQMHNFGISEHTICLNNDLTVDLFRKNVVKTQRPPQDTAVPAVNSGKEDLQTAVDKLESPEPPVFCTPGFKIKKPNRHCSLPKQDKMDLESPCQPCNLQPATPEVPAFQTPYVNRLVSTKKSAQPQPTNKLTGIEINTLEPQTSCNGSKHSWEDCVAEISLFGFEDKQMPEMPNLESLLGNSLQTRNGKLLKIGGKENVEKDFAVSRLELDGPTQEFSLGTPRIRTKYQEPSTPEMPDLSSVTQDICKLLSQAQMKKTTSPPKQMNVKSEKNRPSPVAPAENVSVVSQSEFQTLPNFLRQMTLSSLNQAINNINRFIEEHQGEVKELTVEDLRRIIGVGAMSPVYILCLKELKRLKHGEGILDTDVYKLITQN